MELSPSTTRVASITALGMLALGFVVYWLFVRGHGSVPRGSAKFVPQQTDPQDTDPQVYESTTAQHSDIAKRVQVEEAQGQARNKVAGWDDSYGQNLGPLDAAGIKVIDSYLRPLLKSAGQELDTVLTTNDLNDPTALLMQANAVRRSELWKAAREALQVGSYAVIDPAASRVPKNKDCIYQQFPMPPSNGRSLSIVFILDRRHYPDLFGALEYEQAQQRYACLEAARVFNSLQFEKRLQLFEQYKEAIQKVGWMSMSEELRRTFPINNTVDERTLIMYTPR